MALTQAQIEEMKKLAEPLMLWIEKNTHPHVKVIVDVGSAEAVEGLAMVNRWPVGDKA